MGYSHVLVAVAPLLPESHSLVTKAVSVVKPSGGRITLVTLAADPEIYNHFAAPMLGDLRELMYEEIRLFLDELVNQAGYPAISTTIATGELSEHILAACRQQDVDLVIYGNHNQRLVNKITCSAKSVVSACRVDMLLVPL